MAVLRINRNNFEQEVLQSEKLVMIDFFAQWCGPCKMLSPVVEELAEECLDVLVCSINTEEEPMLARQYGIMTIPTLLFMKDGTILEKIVGYRDKNYLLKVIEKQLNRVGSVMV